MTQFTSIYLAPEKPICNYDSDWRVEGTLDEAIVAVALRVYDRENVPSVQLRFRSTMQKPDFKKEDHHGANGGAPTALVQDRGMVMALTGRLIVFPNTYQHQLMPCELVDKSRPGHVGLLWFYVVDPRHSFGDQVKSARRVPPQQAEWVADAWSADEQRAFPPKIPRELVDMIVRKTDAVAPLDEAQRVRRELMDEQAERDQWVERIPFGGVDFKFDLL
ncbi:hypothetical protein GGF32_007222 [Allomyces javanicus]|nr:hypothetical protein GGF32_007222 [Allomyces javanicus]